MKHKVNKSLSELIPKDLTVSELKQMEDLYNFLEKSNHTAKKSLDRMIDICVNCYCSPCALDGRSNTMPNSKATRHKALLTSPCKSDRTSKSATKRAWTEADSTQSQISREPHSTAAHTRS